MRRLCTRPHSFYTEEDFTQDEVDRKNELAVQVLVVGSRICKRCGYMEVEVDGRS